MMLERVIEAPVRLKDSFVGVFSKAIDIHKKVIEDQL
jgi:hypothetical protein